MMPQDIPETCNGCDKRFSIEHTISFPKGGLILARHDDAAKEWGALGARSLVPSDNIYEPKINSMTVHGERTRARARQESGTANCGVDIVEEAQGGSGRTMNGAARLVGRLGQVELPVQLRSDVRSHGFWKQGTTTMLNIQIFNLNAVSYLCMMPEKALTKAEK